MLKLVIGDHNVIREGVTIHRGTVQDRSETTIGSHNLLMAYVHVGHDSVIGNHCILVNNTALAGHGLGRIGRQGASDNRQRQADNADKRHPVKQGAEQIQP